MSKYDEFVEDISRYLISKLPNTDEATNMEIAEYIGNRINRLIVSMIEDNNQKWQRHLKSQERHFNKELDRLRRQNRCNNNG